jgi:choline-sulfatase
VSNRPNLLFIFSDQHARHVAGFSGDPLDVTPNLDRLAARGVVFENAYCPSPICVPSRMSMLTARHPYAQECWTNDDFLASDRPTMAHALGAAGYRPTLIGRLHALGPDQLHGYAEREVGDHSPNWIGIPRHDMGVLTNANEPERVSVDRSGPGRSVYELKDHDVAAASVAWLEREAARRKGGDASPFALTVGLMLPHAPYVAAPEDYTRFAGRVGPPRLKPPAQDHPWIRWWRGDRRILDVPEDAALRARTAYYALTWRMDALVGRVLETLARTGLDRNTLVVYASDHGDHIGERGLWWKHTFYEESAAVPMILSWPGTLPQGQRRRQVVNLIDLTATMLEAAGAPALPNAQGRSFLGLARGEAGAWEDETFSEYCTDEVPPWTGGMAVRQRMIRSGEWKLIHYHGYLPQLFDLKADPDESRDLAGDPAHAATRDRLLARLLADWDPEAIDRRMRDRRRDKDLIGAWVRATRPAEHHIWPVRAADNRLAGWPGKQG